MPETQVHLLKGDRAGADAQYRSWLPRNMFPIATKVFDVEGFMATHPGYEVYASGGGLGRDRNGVFNARLDQHFRVSGDNFVRVETDGTVTVLGSIPGNFSLRAYAVLPYSFNTQAVVTDNNMWLYDPVNGLQQITDPDLGEIIDACWIDGYYFMTDGEFLYHSELTQDPPTNPNDFIQPLKFATSEFSPDKTRGVGRTQDNQVIVFNRYTTEFFYNTGQLGFVFERIQGKATNFGIVGTHCKIDVNGKWFCLGSSKDSSPGLYIIGAGQAISYGNRETDDILGGYTDGELQFTTFSLRDEDEQSLLYVRLLRHTLMCNLTAAETVGFEYAWSVLTSGVGPLEPSVTQPVIDVPLLSVNPVWDPRINRWIWGNAFLQGELWATVNTTAAQVDTPTQLSVATPFINLEEFSIDAIEVRTLPGQADGIVNAFIAMSYDGVTYSREWSLTISKAEGDFTRRFIVRRLGYVRNWVTLRIRIVSLNKVSLCDMRVLYS